MATPVVAYQFWDEFLQMMGVPVFPVAVDTSPEFYPTEFASPAIQERVEFLQGLSLDEAFLELLDGRQYFMYIPPTGNYRCDMRQILGSRTFLKVFQQFSELPREQALEKLHQFSERAIKEYENALELSFVLIAAQKENPSWTLGEYLMHRENLTRLRGPVNLKGAKYMLCTTMLMAASMGEYELLLYQIDAMQSLLDAYLERIGADRDSIFHRAASLEGGTIFAVLMYALERKEGELDVDIFPFFIDPLYPVDLRQVRRDHVLRQQAEGVAVTIHPDDFRLRLQTVSLYRWNAFVTYFELGIHNPNDLVEKITIYTPRVTMHGSGNIRGDIQVTIDQQMQLVLDSLKERFSRL